MANVIRTVKTATGLQKVRVPEEWGATEIRQAMGGKVTQKRQQAEMTAQKEGVGTFLSDVWEEFKTTGGLTRNAITATFRAKQYTPDYDDEGNVVGIRKETDDDYKRRTTMQQKLARRNAPEEGSAANIVGRIAKELVDPIAIATGGAAGISTGVVRLLKLMTAGSAYEGASAALEQQVATGEITDVTAIRNRAIAGGIALPVIDKALRVAGNVIRNHGKKSSNSVLSTLEKNIATHKSEGLTHQVAVERATTGMGLDTNKISESILKAGGQLRPRELPKNGMYSNIKASIRESIVGRGVHAVSETADKFIGSLSTRVKNISPTIHNSLRKFEFESHLATLEAMEEAKPFINAFQSLSKKQQLQFSRLAMNSDTDGMSRFLAIQSTDDLARGYASSRKLLDNLYKEASDAGNKVGFLENYWPRSIKDYNKFLSSIGEESTNVRKVVREAERKKGSPLDPDETADVLNKAFRTHPQTLSPGRTSSFKARTVYKINEKDIGQYMLADEALAGYIRNVVHNVSKRRFFGQGRSTLPKYNESIDDSIGDLLNRELKAGTIKASDLDTLHSLLSARFGGGERAMSQRLQRVKNFFYAVTLGNPLSAATQLGDLGISGIVNGLGNTVRAILTKSRVSPEDIGINIVNEEFSSTLRTAKVLNFVLKYSGFRTMDRFGKEVNVNAALGKYKSMVKTDKGIAKLEQEFGASFKPEEFKQLVATLKKGEVDHNVKYLLWNALSDSQPISLSELPEVYLNNPNMRIFYMLQSFTIKQFDLMRRTAFQDITGGKPIKGSLALLRLGMILTAANMGADSVKNFMRGRDVEFEDSVINNVYRNFGTSEYMVNQLGRGQLEQTAAGILLTPINIAGSVGGDVVGDLGNLGQQFKSLKHVPLVGKVLYDWFGGGIEEYNERHR